MYRLHLARTKLAALAATAILAASCTLVGEGDLHVQNDLSGIGADNTIFRAFEADTGDVFPPSGYLNLFVRGDDFGSPPAYGLNSYLYLVRTDDDCPMSEGAPETFELADVTLIGIVTITGGTANQFLLMPDAPGARQQTFALIEINELDGFPGEHYIHRCGEVTWS
jgi:hypothetical protein